jgi:ssDNA-binding Zn-finger/Zn-ribbon topoisomerase 1
MKQKFPNGAVSGVNCPNCFPEKFVVRTNRENDSQFLGCPNYPQCTETAPIPEEWIMRQNGQKELFDDGDNVDGDVIDADVDSPSVGREYYDPFRCE